MKCSPHSANWIIAFENGYFNYRGLLHNLHKLSKTRLWRQEITARSCLICSFRLLHFQLFPTSTLSCRYHVLAWFWTRLLWPLTPLLIPAHFLRDFPLSAVLLIPHLRLRSHDFSSLLRFLPRYIVHRVDLSRCKNIYEDNLISCVRDLISRALLGSVINESMVATK